MVTDDKSASGTMDNKPTTAPNSDSKQPQEPDAKVGDKRKPESLAEKTAANKKRRGTSKVVIVSDEDFKSSVRAKAPTPVTINGSGSARAVATIGLITGHKQESPKLQPTATSGLAATSSTSSETLLPFKQQIRQA